MAEPFLSEIRMMSFVFPPQGWSLCNGQLLPINQNQALFSLLGTTYGGNGQTNFALPNLQGRVPMHFGPGHTLGEMGGELGHTLITSEVPTHTHSPLAQSGRGTTNDPTGNRLAATGATTDASTPLYTSSSPTMALHPESVDAVGGSQPHENRQPFLTISFCIALQGIFPSQT